MGDAPGCVSVFVSDEVHGSIYSSAGYLHAVFMDLSLLIIIDFVPIIIVTLFVYSSIKPS